jgi:hypothetical protein
MEAVIEHLRDDVHLETVNAEVRDPGSGRAQEATIAFTLSYENQSPKLARNVANEDDALAFSPYVDAALMIVEDSKTEKEDLQRALGLLQSIPMIGTVLNRSDEATYFIKRT